MGCGDLQGQGLPQHASCICIVPGGNRSPGDCLRQSPFFIWRPELQTSDQRASVSFRFFHVIALEQVQGCLYQALAPHDEVLGHYVRGPSLSPPTLLGLPLVVPISGQNYGRLQTVLLVRRIGGFEVRRTARSGVHGEVPLGFRSRSMLRLRVRRNRLVSSC
jgi:hypothetical protein